MTLSLNEIKNRAVAFSKEYKDDFNEDAEAKSFMDAFFNVFGVSRRRVASFEQKVNKGDGKNGFIDLLWKQNILIEFKSKGKDLNKAHNQAIGYFPGLKDEDLPKYIMVSDFAKFRLYNLEENISVEFELSELVNNIHLFGFISGYEKKTYKEQDPANIKAAESMGKLHDRLKEIGYDGHPLEVYLVRILFCLFAEDTTIFEKQQFQDYILQRTNEDGSDLASKLQELFQVLNTSKEKRFKNLDEQLAEFEYVNGKLFEEILPMASFDSKMRQALLDCCAIDWSKISPAIFGSMFQSVMNKVERRNLGAHYTSEKNILKLIKPLFLDDLWKEFNTIKDNKNKLPEFHKRISKLRFFDPACGCGNFLVICYRELRLLELEILRQQYKTKDGTQTATSIESIILLDVDMMTGIEYEEFPARIAEVAMWLIDHQMNRQISNEFGQYFNRLPLKKAAKIIHGNALQIDWETVIPKTELSYILGNPPFIGSRLMNKNQKKDLINVFEDSKNIGELDYVTGWYIAAAKYINDTKIKVGFVSTNSIVQGLQTSILWGKMLNQYNIKIHFAHRTFKWSNEAKGNAAVYCVIIGFANYDVTNKSIFEYENINGEPLEIRAKNINPYLVDAKNIFIDKKSKPISKVPEMNFGNMPADGGEFLFTTNEMNDFLVKEPNAKQFFKPFISAHEFINKKERWCLWLQDIEPSELKKMKYVLEKVQNVKAIREISSRPQLANIPQLFAQITQPKNLSYILIPRHSSENRKYIPMGFFESKNIAADSCLIIPNGTLYHFGVLMSTIHMAWVKSVCGRLESRFRYSKDIVYNNYPWPENPSDKQIKSIETASQKVLDARLQFPNSSLADLYDNRTMPQVLLKAHNDLDKAVDSAYRSQSFTSEANRMVFLFELYEKYTADLFTKEISKKKKK